MSSIFLVTFMSLFMVSQIILAKFLHDPSGISICPLKHENDSDFGFAMGYQSFNNQLVIGAPSENVHGSVYICNMNGANVSYEIKCEEQTINIPKSSRLAKSDAFRLGASVSATSKHYLTCAPLWTANIRKKTGFGPDVVGTCFFDGDHKPYSGIYEQFKQKLSRGTSKNFDARIFIGGSGWTTLTDEANDLLIVVKSSLRGDIVYSPISTGKLTMKSIVSRNKTVEMWTSKHFNLGYGIIAGKFFSKKTVYAFSMDTKDMRGVIAFLDYDPPHLNLMASDLDKYTIESKGIATKFGSVLAAADMNNDTWDDLLIGEPLYTEEDCVDCGALHVYLGGDLDTIGKKNYLQILGIDSFGRLGSTIAVNDLDGDGIAEISVSAPYADEGLGVVYIISGYEVNQKLQMKEKLRLQLSELKYAQRVQKEDFRTLGFSLQFVSDTDDNGCSELVAGAPGKGEAVLLKCVQTIEISLSSKIKDGKDVKEQDLNFIVQVCANVTYPKKPNDIDAHIKLTSDVIGEGIVIPDPEIEVNVSCRNCSSNKFFCEDVFVRLIYKEPGDYLFKSKAELLTDHIFTSTVFNSSWVVATPNSTLQTETQISRHCPDDDCKPILIMKLFWSRSKEDTYTIGSSSTETAIIEVFNNGSKAYDACVWVKVKGAQLSRLLDNECREDRGGYRCHLTRPLRKDGKANIKLLLKMDSSNVFKQLELKAYLYEKCSSDVSNEDPKVLVIPYVLSTSDVSVRGTNHERQFHELQQQDNKTKIMDVQEFLITNNGKVTWKNIYATVSTNKTVNIETFKATLGTFVCKEVDTEKEFIRKCSLDIMPNTTLKVIATTHILRRDLETHLINKKLKVEYAIQLHLIPTKDIKKTSIFSVLKFGTELAVGQNKLLIGIIAGVIGLLMLIVIFIVLYKNGFFKREEKKKLLVHRESIRQRSTRRNTHISSVADEQGVEGIPNAEANDDSDNLFDKDTNTKSSNDDVKIKTKAQVHSQNES